MVALVAFQNPCRVRWGLWDGYHIAESLEEKSALSHLRTRLLMLKVTLSAAPLLSFECYEVVMPQSCIDGISRGKCAKEGCTSKDDGGLHFPWHLSLFLSQWF